MGVGRGEGGAGKEVAGLALKTKQGRVQAPASSELT